MRSEQERNSKSLTIDAILGIHAEQNPRMIESMLRTYLPKSQRAQEAVGGEPKQKERRAA